MPFKLMSFNIRFDNPNDGDHIWSNRLPIISELINSREICLLGTQEGREPQLRELEAQLDNLEIVDNHREWIADRMYPCIFYRTDTFSLIDSSDIWISDTPNMAGSKSFGSMFPRLCTWAKLINKKSNEKILFVNVHLDHTETTVRQSQIKVMIEEIKKIKEDFKLVINGDFNESPKEDVYKIITKDLSLLDPWKTKNLNEETSYHKFKGVYPEGSRIDWILTDKSINCLEIEIIKHSQKNIYPSDHFPVFSILDF